ncbi:HK97-gp10 family putative phage morphogenesis protein [Sanyastnella coralliicola]|uniref:HK97-gp10 family putative phage morphogenesis protein n=1 Tax=Sanyastnella coralliicola TaxID=3069118 RepID=UPI0027BA5DB8|nr:HK97-gp10 family putative phage morphogenesis protein [Longitalea sp. SCSIO 12813]
MPGAQAIDMKLEGAEQIQKLLQELPPALKKSVLISAQKKAAKPVVQQMIRNLDSSTKSRSGNLKKSIGTKTLKDRGRETTSTITGPRVGGRFKGYHAHLIEHGTSAGERTSKKGYFTFKGKGGKTIRVRMIDHPGTKARPFAKPAIESKKEEVVQAFSFEIGAALNRVMKRTIKKAKR